MGIEITKSIIFSNVRLIYEIDINLFFRAKKELKSLSKRILVGCDSGFETNQSFLVPKGKNKNEQMQWRL